MIPCAVGSSSEMGTEWILSFESDGGASRVWADVVCE